MNDDGVPWSRLWSHGSWLFIRWSERWRRTKALLQLQPNRPFQSRVSRWTSQLTNNFSARGMIASASYSMFRDWMCAVYCWFPYSSPFSWLHAWCVTALFLFLAWVLLCHPHSSIRKFALFETACLCSMMVGDMFSMYVSLAATMFPYRDTLCITAISHLVFAFFAMFFIFTMILLWSPTRKCFMFFLLMAVTSLGIRRSIRVLHQGQTVY